MRLYFFDGLTVFGVFGAFTYVETKGRALQ